MARARLEARTAASAAAAAGAEITLVRRGPNAARFDASPEVVDLVVVGSGPAGLTAAIYAARANLAPVVIAGYAAGGQLMLTGEVENFPGFPEGISGEELIGRMQRQAERFGARFIDRDVDRVDLGSRPFGLWLGTREIRTQALIFAMGAQARWLGLESEQEFIGRGVSACGTCDGAFCRDMDVAVVGGGDAAIEEALQLRRYARRVYLVHRRDHLRASKVMQARLFNAPGVEVILDAEVLEVRGSQRVEAVEIASRSTGSVRELAVGGLFVAIGHVPSSDILRGWIELDGNGYPAESTGSAGTGLMTPDGTAIPGLFVAGDLHDHHYRQAITAAGDGCRAAMDAERWLEAQGIAQQATAAVLA